MVDLQLCDDRGSARNVDFNFADARTLGADAAWHDDEWEAQPKGPAKSGEGRVKSAPSQRPEQEPVANDEWGKW